MDRTSALLHTARQLRRRIWASMPRGFQILSVWFQITASAQETLGRLVYAEFLRKGVRDMPDIRGKSADQYVQEMGAKIHDPRLADKLPPKYGLEFGARMYSHLMKGLRKPSDVDEVISRFMRRLFGGSAKGMHDGLSLRQAENYMLKGLLNEMRNYRDTLGRQESLSKEDKGESEVKQVDIRDPQFLEKIEDQFPIHELIHDPFVQRELRKIHPDAPLYLQLMLEGYNNEEIVGVPTEGQESMLPHLKAQPMSPQNWHKSKLPKIYQVLKERAQEID